MIKSEKGSSTILVVLVLVAVTALAYFVIIGKLAGISTQTGTKDESMSSFEMMDNDNSAPEEINNDAVDELDDMVVSLDSSFEVDDATELNLD